MWSKRDVKADSARFLDTKSPEMSAVLDHVSERLFGTARSDAMAALVCVTCHQPVGAFRNPVSEKEYRISGMCQACQDGVFGVD